MRYKRPFIIGAIFGLIAPFIGMFAGLQILPALGNVLMFPFLLVGKLVGQPFGDFSTLLIVLSCLLSILLWGIIFMIIANIVSRVKNK